MSSFSFLNSKTSKLALSLIFVATLAACGGSDDAPATVVKTLDTPAVTVGTAPATVAAAKTNVGLLVGSTVTLPALKSTNGVSLPADTKLAFTAIPAGAPATALAGFKLTSAGKVEEGTLLAGSCVFRVTSLNGQSTPPYDITFDPCAIDVQSGGLVASGTTQNINVLFIVNGTPVDLIVPVTVTVVNGQAVLTSPSGGKLTVGLATGASGG